MKSRKVRVVLTSCAVVLMLSLLPEYVMGQRRSATGAKVTKWNGDRVSINLKITDIEGVGAKGLVHPPEYDARYTRPSKAQTRDWAQITVTYDTLPEWSDRLDFKYYVLLLSRERTALKPYSLLEGSVAYIDVKQGNGHMSTVFVTPNTLERYGEVVAVAVEIAYEKETVSATDIGSKASVMGQWWTEIRGHDTVEVKSGYVLNRNQTPFAFINYSDYETILD